MKKLQLDDTVLNANDLVSSVLERWRGGEQPNTAEILDSHPELRDNRSLVVDLAYVEYCLRKEAGEDVTARDFGNRFPSYSQAIQRSIEVHEYLGQNPEFAAEMAGPVWPVPGDEVAGFQISELLGRGALARVYLAREPAVGNRLVVVKVSQDGASEAQLLGKLSHENIMEIYSVRRDEPSAMTAICTPLVGTATLVDLLNVAFAGGSPPLGSGVIARVARQHQPAGTPAADLAVDSRPVYASYVEAIAHLGWQLALALEAAHRAGITHRDIKPSNVLLSWCGRALLLDFNLSTDPEQPLKRLGGTHAYMPPERLRTILSKRTDLDQRTDPRADVYSWGVLVQQLLTGKLPFSPADVPADEDAQLEAWLKCRLTPAESPRTLNPQVDPELAAIVAKCIEPEPSARYATAQELVQQLEQYLSPRSRALRLARRNRRGVLAAGGLVMVSAAAAAGYIGTRPDFATRQYRLGLAHYERNEFDEAIAAFDVSLQERPDFSAAQFARAQTYRQTGDFGSARSDFAHLVKIAPGIEYYRCLGFCEIELKHFRTAQEEHENAIGRGFGTADIYSNLAYCHLRCSSAGGVEIRKAAGAAIQLQGDLVPARFLRVEGTLRFMASPSARMNRTELPPESLEDIAFLLQAIGSHPRLHDRAARILELGARQDPALRGKAQEQIRKLYELGKTRAELQRTYDAGLVTEALAGMDNTLQQFPALQPEINLIIVPSLSPVLA